MNLAASDPAPVDPRPPCTVEIAQPAELDLDTLEPLWASLLAHHAALRGARAGSPRAARACPGRARRAGRSRRCTAAAGRPAPGRSLRGSWAGRREAAAPGFSVFFLPPQAGPRLVTRRAIEEPEVGAVAAALV